jgi:hypothetical protein
MTDTLEEIFYNLDDEERIPMLVLTDELGEGEVHIGREFMEANDLQRADLLQDWMNKLQDMYHSVTNGRFMEDMGAAAINQPPYSRSVN